MGVHTPFLIHVIEEGLEFPRTVMDGALAQRLGFDLANAFARNRERSTDLLQCVLRAILDTKPDAYDFSSLGLRVRST